MRQHVLPLLVALNLALGGLLAWLWLTPEGEWRDLRWQPPPAVPPALAETKPLPEFDVDVVRYVATLERPLFLPTRRPPPKPEEVAAAPAPDPLPDIRLLGLYGNEQVGGMIANIDGKVRRVKVGESIGTWSVKEVRRTEVVVARADDVRTIELKRGPAEVVALGAEAEGSSAMSAPTTRASSSDARRQRDIERARNQVRRMNALRARSGLPPLPEP